MPGTKVNVSFYFDDMTPVQVNQAFPQLLPAIKAAKVRTSKLGIENTTHATYHYCYHDEPEKNIPCAEIAI